MTYLKEDTIEILSNYVDQLIDYAMQKLRNYDNILCVDAVEKVFDSQACEAIGRQPESKSAVTSTLIMGCAIAETTGIYALVIAILLIFVAPNIFIKALVNAKNSGLF